MAHQCLRRSVRRTPVGNWHAAPGELQVPSYTIGFALEVILEDVIAIAIGLHRGSRFKMVTCSPSLKSQGYCIPLAVMMGARNYNGKMCFIDPMPYPIWDNKIARQHVHWTTSSDPPRLPLKIHGSHASKYGFWRGRQSSSKSHAVPMESLTDWSDAAANKSCTGSTQRSAAVFALPMAFG